MYANTMTINRCSADHITIHSAWHSSQPQSCESISLSPYESLVSDFRSETKLPMLKDIFLNLLYSGVHDSEAMERLTPLGSLWTGATCEEWELLS